MRIPARMLVALIVLIMGRISFAGNLYVDQGDSIQDAIDDSQNGDYIWVEKGATYYESLVIDAKSITIRSYDPQQGPPTTGSPVFPDDTVINASGTGQPVVTFSGGGNCTFGGFSLTGGTVGAGKGGGVYCNDTDVSLHDLRVFGNNTTGSTSIERAGGIFITGASAMSVYIDRTIIAGNSSYGHGAIETHGQDVDLFLTNVLIHGNKGYRIVGVNDNSYVEMNYVTIAANEVSRTAVGVYKGRLRISNSIIWNIEGFSGAQLEFNPG